MDVIDLRGHALPIALTVLPWVAAFFGARILCGNWRDGFGLWLIIAAFLWVMSWQA